MAVRSSEPSIATGGFDGAVRLYEADTHARRSVIASDRYWLSGAGEGLITALEFSHDGRCVASGHIDGSVHVWDVDSEREVPCASSHDGAIKGLAFSADGRTLVSVSKSGIKVWDMEGLKSGTAPLPRKPAWLVAIAEHRKNNWLVIGLIDKTTRRYGFQVQEASGALRLFRWASVMDSFTCLDISVDGRFLGAGGTDGTARLYEMDAIVESDEREQALLVPPKLLAGDGRPLHSKAVKSIAFFSDSRGFVTSAMDSYVVVWEVETRKSSLRLQGTSNESYAGAALLSDGRTLVGALADGRVRLWEAV